MPGRRQEAGFTLTELVIIIVMVGALAVFAAPRLNIGGFDAANFRQEVISALRFAQKTATASRCPVRVEVQAQRVRVVAAPDGVDACGNDGDAFAHPSRGGDFVVRAQRDAAISSGTGNITFNARGEFESASSQEIQFGSGRKVTVVAGTGYIDACEPQRSLAPGPGSQV